MQTDIVDQEASKAQSCPWLIKDDGCFALIDGKARDVTPRGRKARALLAYLSAHPDVRVPRERVMSLLWGDRGEPQARSSLRQSLAEIRRSARDLVDADRDHIWIDAGRLAQQDAQLKQDCEAFDDLDHITPEFDEWLAVERARRRTSQWDRLRSDVEALLAEGRGDSALRLAERMRRIDPYNEEWLRLALRAEFEAGNPAGLEKRFQEHAEFLERDLGVSPASETRALHDRLLAELSSAVPLAVRAPPAASGADGDAGPPKGVQPGHGVAAGAASARRRAAGFAMMMLATLAMSDSGGPAWSRHATAAVAPASIAVLPFQDLSEADDYFAEGVAEELLGQLSRDGDLRVVGRTSSWYFKNKAADLPSIGRRLDVDYILEGSVRRAGDEVKVDVSLVETDDGLRLWSHSFQGRMDDIFAIQARIGREVTAKVRRGLQPSAPATATLTTTGEVYSLYLAARGLIRTREPKNLETAAELLGRATRLDPDYAPAWAALGAAIRLQLWRDLDERRRLGTGYVDRALALAPDLAEAHAVMGMLHASGPEALRHLERAVQLDPGNADAWLWLSNARIDANDQQGAFDAIKRMASIDPFWVRSRAFSNTAWEMGLREEARRFDERLIRDHPEPAHREMARGRIAAREGDWSAYVLHQLRAARLAAEEPFEARLNAEYGMLKLGLRSRELLYRNPVTILWLQLARGEVPPLEEIKSRLGAPTSFWVLPDISAMTSRLLLNNGRAGDLVALYDESFVSPEEMTVSEVAGGFLTHAPSLIIALRSTGREVEAAHFAAVANRMTGDLLRQGKITLSLQMDRARPLAVQGRGEAAVSAIERAVAQGWPNGERDFEIWRPRPVLAEEPAFRQLRGNPRFERIDARIQANLARERREFIAAAAERGWTVRLPGA